MLEGKENIPDDLVGETRCLPPNITNDGYSKVRDCRVI